MYAYALWIEIIASRLSQYTASIYQCLEVLIRANSCRRVMNFLVPDRVPLLRFHSHHHTGSLFSIKPLYIQ